MGMRMFILQRSERCRLTAMTNVECMWWCVTYYLWVACACRPLDPGRPLARIIAQIFVLPNRNLQISTTSFTTTCAREEVALSAAHVGEKWTAVLNRLHFPYRLLPERRLAASLRAVSEATATPVSFADSWTCRRS